MKVSEFTREALTERRAIVALKRDGFIPVTESGHPLWKFKRGGWTGARITDVRVAPNGHDLWIKVLR